MEVLKPRLVRPAEKAVPAAQIMCRRGPCKTGHRPLSGVDQKFQVFPDRLFVAEIVILLEQAVEQLFLRRAPHRAELQRLNLAQLDLQRPRIHGNHRGLATVGQRITRNLPHRRQLDQSLAVQLQHQPATYHVAQGSVGLHPVPCLAEFFGKLTSARRWMFTKELANEDYLAVRDYPAPILQLCFHTRQRSRVATGTQVLFIASGTLLFTLLTPAPVADARRAELWRRSDRRP